MSPDEIDRILGASVTCGVQVSVEKAYIAARQSADPRALAALHELLIMMMASVIEPTKNTVAATNSIQILREAVRAVQAGVLSSRH